jgi:hypothetical protein
MTPKNRHMSTTCRLSGVCQAKLSRHERHVAYKNGSLFVFACQLCMSDILLIKVAVNLVAGLKGHMSQV